IHEGDVKAWIQKKIEGRDKEMQFTKNGKLEILDKIIEAEEYEKFLGRKYTGTKRFGLDGGESLVPAMEAVIKTGCQMGVKDIVLGMPHRGRLNVLANVMKKPFSAIFHEFHGGSSSPDDVQGSGDVKYHLGTSSDREFDGNKIHLSLTANPSHLEAVNPVVLGKVRAKLSERDDREYSSAMGLLLHGDAAFAGQGINAECLMLSDLKDYTTGGTIHFVVNNQIGFTTSPQYARSSHYPTDIAKMVQSPIFHANGDDPEAVVYVSKLATEFRQIFKKDVVIDMTCYRRFGHNEGDEPSFTQPLMYANIKNHPSVATIYKNRLIREGVITEEVYKSQVNSFRDLLEKEFTTTKKYKAGKADWFEGKWEGLGIASEDDWRSNSGVNQDVLREVGRVMTAIPNGFNMHKTLSRVIQAREKNIMDGNGIDWATAEHLAFGSLILDGFSVRLSGQDSKRGTFSQRHAEFVDQKTENHYRPLQHLEVPNKFEVIDSPLSEFAVMGYEYGYSLTDPKTLTLWEGQFGDFANGAQVIVDQFISSGEAKWLRMSGLVLLLPHGYEGQGPEHSSARLERYLQLCAENNMQVANCTTPANYFHILRRQMHRGFRKPLIIMTPKSLLRHKRAVSTLKEMGPKTQFHRLLWDDAQAIPGSTIKLKRDTGIKRVILCSGKIYFDILEERETRRQDDTYILRVEQLYPFPKRPLLEELSRFKNLENVIWCQEEPKNMGSWFFIAHRIEDVLGELKSAPNRVKYAGRFESASTATGLGKIHAKQQQELIDQALTI
ncbi:MAG: 2-oxoglutarate dehydrogenase E1 component, partial [Sphingomonadales bacterium]